MILQKDNHFLLSSKDTSLLIHVNEVKKVSLEYLGKRIDSLDYIDGVIRSYPYLQGSEILYDKEKTGYSLNQAKLLFSTLGKGDFFSPSCLLKSDSLSVFDFCFDHAEIKTPETLASLPCPDGGEEELIITLKEKEKNIFVDLCFTTYQDENVISCFQRVRNEEKEALIVNKLASLQIPLINEGYELYSTYGCWSGELSVQHEKVTRGKKVMESLCGWSSARHNPFFFLKSENATFDEGHVIGFNLMYSGNFENSVEMDAFENIRVQVSLSPFSFEKRLEEHECFITPVALFSNSQKGVNKMSQDFHSFINRHIIPKEFRGKDRPIAYNNWEATNFDFNQGKINSLIKKASELGIELFVLDDGWFG
ncbi:MAG: alpha-galactosidase, partial [Bacilli bacterium]|nr:alpha-galactosidase [Bacilli bacterium]